MKRNIYNPQSFLFENVSHFNNAFIAVISVLQSFPFSLALRPTTLFVLSVLFAFVCFTSQETQREGMHLSIYFNDNLHEATLIQLSHIFPSSSDKMNSRQVESLTTTKMKTALRGPHHQRLWDSNVDLLFPSKCLPEKMSMKNDQQMFLAKSDHSLYPVTDLLNITTAWS